MERCNFLFAQTFLLRSYWGMKMTESVISAFLTQNYWVVLIVKYEIRNVANVDQSRRPDSKQLFWNSSALISEGEKGISDIFPEENTKRKIHRDFCGWRKREWRFLCLFDTTLHITMLYSISHLIQYKKSKGEGDLNFRKLRKFRKFRNHSSRGCYTA